MSTDWTVGANWGGTAPANTDDATIPTGLANYPEITASQTITIKTVTVDDGGSMTVSGGTFNVTNGITDNGTFNQSGGTILVAGNVKLSTTANASTFNQTGGTLHLASALATNPTDNLEINRGGTFNQGGDVNVKDFTSDAANMTLAAGTLNQTAGTFKIYHDFKNAGSYLGTGGTWQVSGTGGGNAFNSPGTNQFFNVVVDSGITAKIDEGIAASVSVLGNWTNNGTVDLDGRETLVTFSGTGAQSIGGTASTTFRNVTVNKASGSLTLSGNQTIADTLTFTSGNVTTGSNTLIVTSAGTVSGASGATGYVAGNLQKSVAAGSNVARTFEVGTGSAYTPVALTFATVTGGTGTFTVGATAGDHPDTIGGTSGIASSRSVNAYWTFQNGSTSYNHFSATFDYTAAITDGAATPSNFSLQKKDGGTWTSPTLSGTPTATSLSAVSISTPTGTNSDDFAIGELGTDFLTLNLGAGSGTIGEGDTASLTVTFTDSGDHTATITWGDGSTADTAAVSSGQVFTHQYGDDFNPAAVTVSVAGSLSGSQTANLTVTNVAPSIGGANLAAASISEGSDATVTVDFSDPAGANDTYTATIAWGDGATSVVSGVSSGQAYSHTYADGPNSYDVVATINDEDGGTSSASTSSLSVGNVAPSISAADLAAASISEGSDASLTIAFSDPADANDAYTATIVWGDGATSIVSGVSSGQVYAHTYADGPNSYDVVATVNDEDGGTSSASTSSLSVGNVAPSISAANLAAASINEGDTASITVDFSDPAGANDTYTATVVWGDGATSIVAGVSSGQVYSHTYADGPNSFSVSATIADSDGDSSSTVAPALSVGNVAPSLSAANLAAAAIDEGSAATIAVDFSDPAGANDTYTATIVWGDGATSIVANVSSGQVYAHVYADGPNSYSVSATIADSDGDSSSTSVSSLTVSNVAPDITDLDLAASTIGQNGTATLDVTFTDPGDDTHVATITWGDGATSILPVTSGQSFTHQYTATANPATISVVVTDSDGESDVSATSVVVQPFVIDAVDDTATVAEDTTLSAAGNVIGNDTISGGAATVTAVNGSTSSVGVSIAGTYGNVTIGSNGAYTYSLDNNAAVVQALAGGATVSDTFTYTIANGLGGSDTATLTVNVGGTNDAPVIDASGNPISFSEEGPVNNGVLVSDLIASGAADMITDVDTGAVEGIAVTGVDFNSESFTAFTDNFNRGALGDDYATQVGAGLALNGATASTAGFSLVVNEDEVHTDVAVQATVTVGGNGSFAGLVARYNGVGDNNLYLATLANVGGTVTVDVWKNVAGAYTKLSTSAPLGTNTGILRFEIVGNNLRVFFNDVLRGEISDSSLAGAGRIGLRASGGTFDNLLVEPVTVPALTVDDDFDRAAVGGDYTTQVGAGFVINGGKLTSMGFSLATNNKAAAKTNVSVTVDIALNGANSFAGVVTRYAGPGDTNLYLGTMANNGTNNVAEIWKNVNGTYTKLTSQVIASGTGTLKFEVLGSVLTLSVNGVVRGQVFDTSLVNGGFIGVRGSNGTTFDNLKIRNASLGTWQFSTDDGGSWTDMGDVSDASRRLLAADANTRVRFMSNPGAASSSVLPSLQFRAWDQTSGANGGLDTSMASGGSSAFSSGMEFSTNPLFVNDSFTAAFEAGWQSQVAGLTVTGNQVTSTTSFGVSSYNAFSAADVVVEADVSAPNNGNFVGLLGRYQGPGDANTYAAFLVNSGGQGLAQIWKNVGGTWTNLSSAVTGATAGTLRLEIFGKTLRVFFNDALMGTAQDTSITTAGVTGIRVSGNGATLDNFAAERVTEPNLPVYTDLFDRANNASLGSNYNEINDGATIVGNHVQLDAFSLVAVKNQFVRDVSAEATITLTPDASNVAYAGLAVRHAGVNDSNMYWAALVQVGADFSVQLWKAAPNFTSATSTVALPGFSGTGQLRVEALGSSLKVYVDGVLKISINDTSLTGAGFVSLRGFKANIDNLEIDAL